MTKPSPVRKLLSARAVMTRERGRRAEAGPSIVTLSCSVTCHALGSVTTSALASQVARVGEAVTMTETAAADGESERDLNNLCSVSGLMIRLAAATSGHSLVVTMAHCTPQPCNV